MSKQHIQPNGARRKPGCGKSTGNTHPWYKRYPEDYRRGTRRLSLAARGAYSDLIDLMFIEDGGLPDDDMYIACALHVTRRQWRLVRKELFDTGKIFIGDDGLIHNRRADVEISDRAERVERASSTPPPRSSQRHNRKKLRVINGGKSTESDSDLRERESSSGNSSRSHEEEDAKPLQLAQAVVEELREAVGDVVYADALVAEYLTSEHARNARFLNRAFKGWLRAGGILITGAGKAAPSRAEVLALCPKDEHGRAITALPKTVTPDTGSWRTAGTALRGPRTRAGAPPTQGTTGARSRVLPPSP